jgi:signal peptidase II
MDQRNTGIKRYLIALLGIAAAVFIDQITKHLAVLYLKGNPARVIIDGVFELQYLENRGAAFGMMQNMQYVSSFFIFISGCRIRSDIFRYGYALSFYVRERSEI